MSDRKRIDLTSRSPAGTEALGRAVGELCRAGDVIALSGELGSGKTAFVRGLASSLGADPRAVSSPTFVLMQEYEATPPVLHIDAYRIESLEELGTTGWTSDLAGESVSVIEWAERVADELPKDRLVIRFSHGAADVREIEVVGLGDWAARTERVRAAGHPELSAAADGRCPVCGAQAAPSGDVAPFCSHRCKTIDLGNWLSGGYRLTREIDWENDDLAAMEEASSDDEGIA